MGKNYLTFSHFLYKSLIKIIQQFFCGIRFPKIKKEVKRSIWIFSPNFHLLKKKYRSVNENYLANCRIKLQKLHRFTEAGLDEDSLQETIEGLHTLSDCYQANSDAI